VKLYELIEEGALVTGEDHRGYLRVRTWRDVIRERRFGTNEMYCCALGTAYVALVGEPEYRSAARCEFSGRKPVFRDLRHAIGASRLVVNCPRCSYRQDLLTVVDHLHRTMDEHDGHEWPRLKIVEWLKPIEDAYAAAHPEAHEKSVSRETVARDLRIGRSTGKRL